MIEYTAVYQPGTTIVRCAGDDGCGAHLNTGDMELHSKFHEKIEASLNPWAKRPKRLTCHRTVCLDLPAHPPHPTTRGD